MTVARSSSANAPMMVSIAFPIGPFVSIPSVTEWNPIPRSVSPSTNSSRFFVLRAIRSSFHTSTVSPFRRCSSILSNSGRLAFDPLTP